MTKEELWNIYARKNPQFEGSAPVTMTAVGLRKLFDQTWDHAFAAGQETGKTTGSLFDRVFGS